MKKRTIIDLVILLFVLIIGIFAVKNAVAIGDWWFFMRYTPPDEVVEIAEDAGMSDYGKKLFYRLDPQFVDRESINDKCGSDVLGCTVGRNIYILNDHTPSQYNRSIVTAAHEMLHVAYSRITDEDKLSVNDQLDEQFKSTDDDLLKKFSNFTDANYYNEAHSYIGSEEQFLSSELKAHYAQYFDDRQKVITALKYSPEN